MRRRLAPGVVRALGALSDQGGDADAPRSSVGAPAGDEQRSFVVPHIRAMPAPARPNGGECRAKCERSLVVQNAAVSGYGTYCSTVLAVLSLVSAHECSLALVAALRALRRHFVAHHAAPGDRPYEGPLMTAHRAGRHARGPPGAVWTRPVPRVLTATATTAHTDPFRALVRAALGFGP